MSPIRGTAVAVLTIAALLLDAGAAAAIADTPGGVAAPASPQAGGTQYGMPAGVARPQRSEEHTSELQSRREIVCRLLLEKNKKLARSGMVLLRSAMPYSRYSPWN